MKICGRDYWTRDGAPFNVTEKLKIYIVGSVQSFILLTATNDELILYVTPAVTT